VRFCLLGPLEGFDDRGNGIALGAGQARTVIAVLLTSSGFAASTDAIIDVLWGATPPPSAVGTLQSYVSRLRRYLEPDRRRDEPSRLAFEPPNYRLAIGADDVDSHRFEVLADDGRDHLLAGRAEEARRLLVEALALWRGPALSEFRHAEFAAGSITRLEGRRMAALDDRLSADLALGAGTAIIGELSELIAEHPLQESFRHHHALALYRAGRQADALRSIDAARCTLRDELGVAPGRQLRELETAILAHDPELDAPGPAAGARTRDSEGPAPLVGRSAELDTLRVVAREATGATRSVIIEGEAGIGKTRLAEQLGTEAGNAGATVLWGRAFEGGAAPAYWPWLPPLRELRHRTDLGGAAREELDRLLAPTSSDDAGTGASRRYALVDAVTELLRADASATPLVIVFDDLQWADIASLELLKSVATRVVDEPVLLVVTVRELDVGRNDSLVATLAALTRRTGTRRIQLSGLSVDHSAALVEQTAGDTVDPSLLPQIHARAEGNPFYLTELSRLLATGNVLSEVPSGVRDVVRQRVAQLPPASTELLHAAAVIGRSFDLELLARATHRDLGSTLDDLEPAVVQRLLAPVPERPTGFRFAHALVREVLVDGMSSLALARLHLEIAEALEDTDDTAEIRADHLWRAAPVGSSARAADALERAAHVAIRRRSLSAAERLLERAVPLRRATGSTRHDRETELRTIELLISVIGARWGQAMLIDSPLLARGKELAVETGLDQRLQSLLWVEWAGLDQACLMTQADPIAAELLARAELDDSPLSKVIGHEAWGIHLWHHGRIAEAAEHFDAAVDAGARLPPEEQSALLEPDQLRLPLPFSVYVHDLMDDWPDPEAQFDEVVRRMPDDPYWELVVRNFEAWSALATGHPARAERAARRGIDIDPEGISTFWSMQVRCYLGAALCQQGRIDEGVLMIRDGWATYTEMGLRVNGGTYFAESALALAKQGRLVDAESALATALDLGAAGSEHYADALLLLAEAAIARARGDGSEVVGGLLSRARAVADDQGARGIVARIDNETRVLSRP
jgi:DNA-binding SARP family transcriptional activator/tetratricopeptide (TPR) repeat protein